ncbi:MAG: metal ABC transporter permease [Azoarcus sp.]|jgi:zinc transport system permease protein|nr:metal ABC transporter permease [Azoarcus sp.]
MTGALSQLALFWSPALTGAALALLLPLLGLYLRLRREHWAALAYGQLGAAGALGALALGLPPLAGGLAASFAVAGAKHRLEKRLPAAGLFPLLFILGWSASLLLTANLPGVERLGAALFEGQLYFAGQEMLAGSAVALIAGGLFLRRAGPLLLLACLCPAHFQSSRLPAWPARAAFDLLAAAALALAVMSLGVMGAFALVFIPPWLAFALAANWRTALVAAPVLALCAHTLAFALALIHDQPFGPVLAAVLGLSALALPLAAAARPGSRRKTGQG